MLEGRLSAGFTQCLEIDPVVGGQGCSKKAVEAVIYHGQPRVVCFRLGFTGRYVCQFRGLLGAGSLRICGTGGCRGCSLPVAFESLRLADCHVVSTNSRSLLLCLPLLGQPLLTLQLREEPPASCQSTLLEISATADRKLRPVPDCRGISNRVTCAARGRWVGTSDDAIGS